MGGWAIEELDFDGLRFDFVKGYGAWMIGLLAKYRYQKKDGREFTPFVVDAWLFLHPDRSFVAFSVEPTFGKTTTVNQYSAIARTTLRN